MPPPVDTVRIKSFNPYVARFPDRKVVSGDVLTLIKALREEGKKVVVEPEDDRPLQYLFQKGLQEFLKDPVIAYFVSIPTGIACSLIASAIDRAWQRHQGASAKEPLPEQLGVVIKIGEGPEAFSHKGTVLEPAWVKHMLAHQKEARRAYREVRARKSPYPSLPVPLFEEHIPRVVGGGQ